MPKKTKKAPKSTPATVPNVQNTISDSSFTGVHWDTPSLEVLDKVAQALLNLSELFKSQNVRIESLLRIGSDVATIGGNVSFQDGRASLEE